MKEEQLNELAKELAKNYTNSPYTTNAGKILRIAVRFMPVNFLLKLLQAKMNKI